MSILAFPVPKIDQYQIMYDPITHLVDIPAVPDNTQDAACILAVFIDVLIDAGTLTADEVYMVALQATGNL